MISINQMCVLKGSWMIAPQGAVQDPHQILTHGLSQAIYLTNQHKGMES